MTNDRKDELPACPWCRRAIHPRHTQLATAEGLLHFGCERDMRIARKRRAEGRHTEADRLALARVEPDTEGAPCTDDGTTDSSTSDTGGGATGTDASADRLLLNIQDAVRLANRYRAALEEIVNGMEYDPDDPADEWALNLVNIAKEALDD